VEYVVRAGARGGATPVLLHNALLAD